MGSQILDHYFEAPGPVLTDYFYCRDRIQLIMGPLGSAKTMTTVQKIMYTIAEQKPNASNLRLSRWFFVRNTSPDLDTTTKKDWLEVWGDARYGRFVNSHPATHYLDFPLRDGTRVKAEVIFLALDRMDSIKKLRGTQATGFWLNEVKELLKPIVDMCDLRHGRYPSKMHGGVLPTWHGIIGDTNAPDEDHWYYKLAEEDHPDGFTFFRQPGGVIKNSEGEWELNPNAENIKNLPENYYYNGLQGKDEDWIKVNLGNEYGFSIDGKAVWPHYKDSVHCAKQDFLPNKSYPCYIGIDFGLTPAATFAQLVGDQWMVFDEMVSFDMDASVFGEELKRKIDLQYPHLNFEGITGDPAGNGRSQVDSRTPFDVMLVAGINAVPAHTNDPLIRIEAVARHLRRLSMTGRPGFLISPRCKMLRKAMAGGYCYRRIQVQGEERYRDVPDKNNPYSHVADSLQYLFLGAGEDRAVIVPTGAHMQQINVKRSVRSR